MMERDRDGAWFAPKRYGYGSGLPVAWQGWLAIGLYVLVFAAASFLIGRSIPAYLAVAIAATLLLILVSARTTRGGWPRPRRR
jgi:hypothetical protein